jgi:5-methyltetrahydrofolate--homocysteine methyltransferase
MSSLFRALASDRVLLMDGAFGTELLRAKTLAPEENVALANVTRPDAVLALHRAYRRAGAEIVLTNTFQADAYALARAGVSSQGDAIVAAGVQLARKAGAPFVLADVGPLLALPDRTECPDRAVLRRLLHSLEGADGVLFETWSSPRALDAVAFALHEVPWTTEVPLFLSLAYRRTATGKVETISGHAPETFARHAVRHGVAALGVNCGVDIGLQEITEILGRYRRETDLPLFARPNAGTLGNLTPMELAAHLPEWIDAGLRLIGGCCGTTPAHIEACANVLRNISREKPDV